MIEGIVGVHVVIVAVQVPVVVEEAEIVAEAHAATDETVEAFADVALVEEVRVEFQSPRVVGVAFLAHTDGDFCTEVELDGEVVGNDGFVGECLHIAGGEAEAMRVWGLGIAAESGQDCKNCNNIQMNLQFKKYKNRWILQFLNMLKMIIHLL